MTDGGLQRLAQSRCGASSGITDDVEDACRVGSGVRWSNGSLRNDGLSDAQMRERRVKVGGCENTPVSQPRCPLIATSIDGLSMQLVDHKNC